jgi:hypothetical protein
MTPRLGLDDVLAAARSAAEPESGEAARVRERLSVVPLVPPSARAASLALSTSLVLSPRQRLAQLGLWGTGAIALFLAGFLLGRSSVPSVAVPEPAAPVAAEVHDSEQRTAALPPPPQRAAVEEPAPPSAPEVASAEVERAPPRATISATLSTSKSTSKSSSGKSAGSTRGVGARQQRATDLGEVVRRLREAQRASRAGEGTRALAVLDELDRRVALALLAEERQVTRVLALCSAQQPEPARRLAREVLSAHPGSVYSARLEHSCAELQGDEALLDAIRQRVRE